MENVLLAGRLDAGRTFIRHLNVVEFENLIKDLTVRCLQIQVLIPTVTLWQSIHFSIPSHRLPMHRKHEWFYWGHSREESHRRLNNDMICIAEKPNLQAIWGQNSSLQGSLAEGACSFGLSTIAWCHLPEKGQRTESWMTRACQAKCPHPN